MQSDLHEGRHLGVDGLDLEAWVRKVYAIRPLMVSDTQAWFACGAPDADCAIELAAERYLGVGTLEYRAEFLGALASTLDWPPTEPTRVNVSRYQSRFTVTEEARAFIESINVEDARFHQWVLEVWRRRLGVSDR